MMRGRWGALYSPTAWMGIALAAPFALARQPGEPAPAESSTMMAEVVRRGWSEPTGRDGWPLLVADRAGELYHVSYCPDEPAGGRVMDPAEVPESAAPCPLCKPPVLPERP